MANTYSQIYHHYIFAVQHRQCLIQPDWKEELYKYMTGCVTNHGCKMLSIGGVADHIHILTGMNPDVSCATLMADVKRSSTLWINSKFYRPGWFLAERIWGFQLCEICHPKRGEIYRESGPASQKTDIPGGICQNSTGFRYRL